jgi:hypothetical protein
LETHQFQSFFNSIKSYKKGIIIKKGLDGWFTFQHNLSLVQNLFTISIPITEEMRNQKRIKNKFYGSIPNSIDTLRGFQMDHETFPTDIIIIFLETKFFGSLNT